MNLPGRLALVGAVGLASAAAACSTLWGFGDASLAGDAAAPDAAAPASCAGGSSDGGAVYVDISGGQGSRPIEAATFDPTNRKLLVVTSAPTRAGLGLIRCEADGTACGYQELVEADAANGVAGTLSSVVDVVTGKLRVFGPSWTVACALDGTDCATVHLVSSAPPPPGGTSDAWTFQGLSAVLAAGRLVYVGIAGYTVDQGDGAFMTYSRLRLLRCDPDGNGCVSDDIGDVSLGPSDRYALLVERAGEMDGNVLVLGPLLTNRSVLGLWRCSIDTAGCALSPITQPSDTSLQLMPGTAFVDATNHDFAVVTSRFGRLGLWRCGLDDGACAATELSDRGPESSPSVAIDPVHSRLLVTSYDSSSMSHGALRCALDGTACTYADLSGGELPNFTSPLSFSVVDPATGQLLIVTTKFDGTPALLRDDSLCER